MIQDDLPLTIFDIDGVAAPASIEDACFFNINHNDQVVSISNSNYNQNDGHFFLESFMSSCKHQSPRHLIYIEKVVCAKCKSNAERPRDQVNVRDEKQMHTSECVTMPSKMNEMLFSVTCWLTKPNHTQTGRIEL